ncbi:DUF1993 family protein [Inhella sp.]|uniref:DUF1993 domain-containing protein n=1 Tax=Inhella sp. TaxID=1921806 RepID=UPI0035B001DB
MSISMCQATSPRFINGLLNLSNILKKAAEHAAAHKIDPNALLQARLYPDMFPLTRQVQIACDQAKGAVARLAGQEPPKHEDSEQSFDDLQARIKKTIAYIESVPLQALDGSESRGIHLKVAGKELTFVGSQYLMGWAWPNFHFHSSMAYAILRHNGVPLGKPDYLGEV